MPIELDPIQRPAIVRKEIVAFAVNKERNTLSVSWGYFDENGVLVRQEDYTWPLIERDEQGQIVHAAYLPQTYEAIKEALYTESVYRGVITQEEAGNA